MNSNTSVNPSEVARAALELRAASAGLNTADIRAEAAAAVAAAWQGVQLSDADYIAELKAAYNVRLRVHLCDAGRGGAK